MDDEELDAVVALIAEQPESTNPATTVVVATRPTFLARWVRRSGDDGGVMLLTLEANRVFQLWGTYEMSMN